MIIECRAITTLRQCEVQWFGHQEVSGFPYHPGKNEKTLCMIKNAERVTKKANSPSEVVTD